MLDMFSVACYNKHMYNENAKKLGKILKSAREQKGSSLRTVEEATKISNAYLSQIESGKIRRPSPNVLHSLSVFYGVPYSALMNAIGYPANDKASSSGSPIYLSKYGSTSNDRQETFLMTDEQMNSIEFFKKEAEEDFSSWINRPYIPEAQKQQLSKANVLITPIEGFRDRKDPVFPVGTEELYHFLKYNSDKGINVDLCISDEDYKELALHSALIVIGGFVVTSFIAPIVVNMVSEYIKNRFPVKSDPARVKVELTVIEPDKKAFRLFYEGPAKDFVDTVQPALPPIQEDIKRIQENNDKE